MSILSYPISTAMYGLVTDVRDFHEACDMPVLSTPAVPDDARVELRQALIAEEAAELDQAIMDNNLVAIADALADLIYVCVGCALEYGIPLSYVWQAVQDSNMDKIDPKTGYVHKREDGKVLKPRGWQPPDIVGIIDLAS